MAFWQRIGLALLTFSLLFHHNQAAGEEKICKLAVKEGLPLCQNRGQIKAMNTSTPTECASCNCPDEWAGAECSHCKSVDSCPVLTREGQELAPIGCTSDLIYPSEKDTSALIPKELSCKCAGHDVVSKFICDSRPDSNWKISIQPNSDFSEYSISIVKLAGTPSQDYAPECSGGSCSTKKRYKFYSPKVWEGKFEGCTWKSGDCIPPLTGESCINYSCMTSDVACPPADVKKCPDWTPKSCGYPHNEYLPYGMHGCDTFSIPASGTPTTISCESTQSINGSFSCTISQDESAELITIDMECVTGVCIYPVGKKHKKHSPSPSPLPSPAPAPPPLPDNVAAFCKFFKKYLIDADWVPQALKDLYKQLCTPHSH